MLTCISEKLSRREPVRLVFYGDSISTVTIDPPYFGGASCAHRHWGQLLASDLRRRFPKSQISAEHFSIGGQNSYEGLGRVDWLKPFDPDLVFLGLGANDCGWHDLPPESTRHALRTLIGTIRLRHRCDLVVLGLNGPNPLGVGWQHFEDTACAVRLAALEGAAPYVDVRGPTLAATRGGETWADFHLGRDDCHPNDRGMEVWAEAIMAVIDPLLPKSTDRADTMPAEKKA